MTTSSWLPFRYDPLPAVWGLPERPNGNHEEVSFVAWIEAHQTLQGHPKTRKAALQLGIGQPQLIGHLFCLWWWALDYAPEGDLSHFAAGDLALAAEWSGEPDAFVAALVDCRYGMRAGFLDRTGDGRLVIHDWHEYAGKLVGRREANARRMRTARADHAQPSSNDTHDTRAAHVQRTVRARAEREDIEDIHNRPSPPFGGDCARPARAQEAPPVSGEPVVSVPKPTKTPPPKSLAVQVYWKAASRKLTEGQQERVTATVGSEEDALVLWGQVVNAWVDLGYKRENITGMLDWYRSGGPPARTAGPGASRHPSNGRVSAADVALSLLRKLEPEGDPRRDGQERQDGSPEADRRVAPDARRVSARYGQAHPGLPAPRQH